MRTLDELIGAAVDLPQHPALDQALFGIFERFPAEDGYGVYWSIVHGLERRGAYEPALLASVRRKPVFFNTLMLGRMLNAGIAVCAGTTVRQELEAVAASTSADPDARKNADDFLAGSQGRSSAL